MYRQTLGGGVFKYTLKTNTRMEPNIRREDLTRLFQNATGMLRWRPPPSFPLLDQYVYKAEGHSISPRHP